MRTFLSLILTVILLICCCVSFAEDDREIPEDAIRSRANREY